MVGANEDGRQTDHNGKDHRKRADRPFDERKHEENPADALVCPDGKELWL